MRFEKSALTIEQQIELLESRGMVINDKPKAAHYLSNISYYRLSAYWYTFLSEPKSEHRFSNKTTFEKAIDTYVFDRRLRLLIFDEIERIEISLRTQMIFQFCHAYGNNWYENKDLYKSPQYYYKFNALMAEEMEKTNEVFIKHYRQKYTDPPNPPSWMVLELASFGRVSTLLKNLKSTKPKKDLAGYYGIHEKVLTSWLESLSYLRNTCAHHSRIWNKKIPKPPVIPTHTQNKWLDIIPKADRLNRIYPMVCVIYYMLRVIVPSTTFNKKLKNLLDAYPQIPKYYMGFPDKWESDSFWDFK